MIDVIMQFVLVTTLQPSYPIITHARMHNAANFDNKTSTVAQIFEDTSKQNIIKFFNQLLIK
jgi:hypothetical protein